MISKETAILKSIFDECIRKYQKGEKKFGPFNPKTDTRCFRDEARQELIDAINYIAMFIRKLDEVGQ